MNVDNINKTIDLINTSKDIQFNMNHYLEEDNECGTSCCLAGYACIVQYGSSKAIPLDSQRRDGSRYTDFVEHAQKFFDIDEKTASKLFLPNETALKVTDKELGVRVLETLRDTGKVVWDNIVPLDPKDAGFGDND